MHTLSHRAIKWLPFAALAIHVSLSLKRVSGLWRVIASVELALVVVSAAILLNTPLYNSRG